MDEQMITNNESFSDIARPQLDTREDESLCKLVGIDIDLKV